MRLPYMPVFSRCLVLLCVAAAWLPSTATHADEENYGVVPTPMGWPEPVAIHVDMLHPCFGIDGSFTGCHFASYTNSDESWLDPFLLGGPPLMASGTLPENPRSSAEVTRFGHCGSEWTYVDAGQLSYTLFTVDQPVSINNVEVAGLRISGQLFSDQEVTHTSLHGDVTGRVGDDATSVGAIVGFSSAVTHTPGEAHVEIEALLWDFDTCPGAYQLSNGFRPANARNIAMSNLQDEAVYFSKTVAHQESRAIQEIEVYGQPHAPGGAPVQLVPGRRYAIGVRLFTNVSRGTERGHLVSNFYDYDNMEFGAFTPGVTVSEFLVYYGASSF